MKLPPYQTYPLVSSKEIILRQILRSDMKNIITIQFYDAKPAKNEEEAFEMQTKINRDYENGNSIHWGIADLQTNKIVGTLGYYRGFDKQTGELGCVLLPEYRGKGYMTKAMALAIDFGFKTMQLKRIISITTKSNHKAIELLERLGFSKIKELQDDEIEFEFRQK